MAKTKNVNPEAPVDSTPKKKPGRPPKAKAEVENTEKVTPKVADTADSSKKEKKFHCPYCQQGFSRRYDMEKHSRKHTGDKPFKCGICGKTFVQVGSLSIHMRSHTGEMPYSCDICKKGFALKDRLTIHKRSHTGEKPYSCDHCDKKFARTSQLIVHKRTHTGDKPYQCPTCSLKFTSSGNLKGHMKLHVGSREFSCHLCDKAYPRADTLKRHLLSFHENKRLYKCDVCGKSFKGHIRDHMRTHAEDREEKPFGCSQCGARFNQRSQLTVHMRVHTGERPYSCKICSRSFSHSTALKLHLRMHTGEKPHICKLCQKSFAQLPHLKKHMLCVHNTDKPYYCEKCKEFFKVKTEYQEHVEKNHPDDIPKDLQGASLNTPAMPEVDFVDVSVSVNPPTETPKKSVSVEIVKEKEVKPKDPKEIKKETIIDLKNGAAEPVEIQIKEEIDTDLEVTMPMEKMRTLLALLLKKISTPGRLKKLGFGTRLIDDVLKESITASGRTPCNDENLNDQSLLKKNIRILLDWTIPEDYMAYFKAENKTIDEILEELAT